MLKYLQQNKHVITVAIALFIVSMSTLFFFLGSDKADYKTDFIQALKVKPSAEQEQQYREFLENDKDPFAVLDLEANVEFSSDNFQTTLGYSADEVNHRLFPLFLNTEDLSIFLGAFSKVTQTHQPLTMIGPYRLRDKNGEDHLNIGSMIPILEDEKITSIIFVSKDLKITLPPEKNSLQPPQKGIPKKNENDEEKGQRLMAER